MSSALATGVPLAVRHPLRAQPNRHLVSASIVYWESRRISRAMPAGIMTREGAGLQLADVLEQRAECHDRSGRPARAAEDLRAAAARYEKLEDAGGAERVRERLAALAG